MAAGLLLALWQPMLGPWSLVGASLGGVVAHLCAYPAILGLRGALLVVVLLLSTVGIALLRLPTALLSDTVHVGRGAVQAGADLARSHVSASHGALCMAACLLRVDTAPGATTHQQELSMLLCTAATGVHMTWAKRHAATRGYPWPTSAVTPPLCAEQRLLAVHSANSAGRRQWAGSLPVGL